MCPPCGRCGLTRLFFLLGCCIQVFELVEDVDKVLKVLINLANMKELQVRRGKRGIVSGVEDQAWKK